MGPNSLRLGRGLVPKLLIERSANTPPKNLAGIDANRKRPRPNQPRAFTLTGARDRARTGDPHVGNVFRPLDFGAFSRETAAGSRIGHARVAAMLRGRYALLREQITLEEVALDIGSKEMS